MQQSMRMAIGVALIQLATSKMAPVIGNIVFLSTSACLFARVNLLMRLLTFTGVDSRLP